MASLFFFLSFIFFHTPLLCVFFLNSTIILINFSTLNFKTFSWGKLKHRFALCYWHAVALSRRGFGPIGWSSDYAFGTSDLRMSQKVLLTVMLWRSKHSHADLVGLQHLVGHIVYGGHIVDAFDRRLCLTYVRRLLTEKVVFNEANCYLANPARE